MALGKGLDSLFPTTKRTTIRKETNISNNSASSSSSNLKPTKAVNTEKAAVSNKDRLWHIPLAEIIANSEQPRKNFSHQELENLVNSIKEHGVMQPITVTERPDGGYELIAGERRFRASQIAGMATIPAIVRSATQQERLELALIENIQRQNLNAIEEGFSFKRLVNQFGLTQQEVSDKVGKSRSHVANTIRLLGLPEEIQKALIDGKLSAGKARALLSLKSEDEQLAMFRSMTGDAMSVRDVERNVANKGQKSRKGSVRRDPNVLAQEQLLEDRLGTRVNISKRGEKGKITIEFNGLDELKRLMQDLS